MAAMTSNLSGSSVCPVCKYRDGYHSSVCVYPYSRVKLCTYCGYYEGNHSPNCGGNPKGECEVAKRVDTVYEVVLVKPSTDDAEGVILFGPKAYLAGSDQSAVLQATTEAVKAGVEVDGSTVARSRFFG